MVQTSTFDLAAFYEYVQTKGDLRTPDHARRWSAAVLKTLGLNLDRGTKKQLAKALPEELAEPLMRVFWLAHFRDTNLSSHDFLNQVARRSGNSDPEFARIPVTAVFGGIKRLIDDKTSARVADSLSPEVRKLWQRA